MSKRKSKLFKFTEEKKEWEKEKVILIENKKVLKQKHDELEKKIEEKGKEPEVQIISPVVPAQTNEEAIVQGMSQVRLRDLEIIGLKNKNKILEDVDLKKEENIKPT